jgi:hypothetical protein
MCRSFQLGHSHITFAAGAWQIMALSKNSLVLLLIAVLNSVDAFAPSCPALVSRKGIEENVSEQVVPETTQQKRLLSSTQLAPYILRAVNTRTMHRVMRFLWKMADKIATGFMNDTGAPLLPLIWM